MHSFLFVAHCTDSRAFGTSVLSFIVQKVIYYFSHHACELLDACLVDDVVGQPIPIDKFVYNIHYWRVFK